MEKLKCENIFEIERIKFILQNTEPELIKIFDYIIEIANQKINDENSMIEKFLKNIELKN